ncbi:hypothetical protein AVEN_100708-1 [Araneus ventricosus]|uniref:Uncharacterized protein n=1 Tax=Araneus ventricosus TaxID=182803 RepID=A0A4Y2CT26_ARAVE|nr:hypothetical protein AVEN_100708-1 [Araneus ventricosus]
MENDALFTNIQKKREAGKGKNTALAQINKSKQQITNNNSNSANNSSQRLAADQLAMRTTLRRRFVPPSIYSLPDRASRQMKISGEIRISALMRDIAIIIAFSRTFYRQAAKIVIKFIAKVRTGRCGLVIRSRLWGRRTPGSKPDSTAGPPCMGGCCSLNHT